jgi:hypothetical protein
MTEWERAIVSIDYHKIKSHYRWNIIGWALEHGNYRVCLYAIWIIKRTQDTHYLPILLRFLRNFVDRIPDGRAKHVLLNEIFETLRQFGTPEALKAIEERQQGQTE